MSPHPTQDPCIPYGRGGAGNMRRRSSIAAAWSTILSHPLPTDSSKLNLISSPEDHYAASKTEPRRRRHSSSTEEGGSLGRKSSAEEGGRGRRSSRWSEKTRASTIGEFGSRWRRLFRRGVLRRENEGKDEYVE